MDWWAALLLSLGGLVFLLAMNIPVAIAFLAVDIVGLLALAGPKGLGLITASIFESVGSITLGAIPLFYLLGEILFQTRLVDIILETVDKWIGSVRARLNIVAIGVGTVLGTLSGAAMADAAVMAATLLPEMLKRGYEKRLAIGTILCAGSLAAIIPPSVLTVLIASLAGVSISKLLIAGIGPGLFLAAVFVLYVLVRVRLNPSLAPAYNATHVTSTDKLVSLLRVLPFLLIVGLVLGLILLGIATPTESAATGAIGTVLVAALYNRMSLGALRTAVISTIRLSAMIFFIVAGSKAFSQYLALSGATKGLLEAIASLDVSPAFMFLIMQLIPFVLGCFIDQISIIVIAIPIYTPVVASLHFDPIVFWILFLINMTVGGITPPFGLVLFTMKGAAPASVSLMDVYRAAIPFIILIVVGSLVIYVFPGVATWIPNTLLK